MSKLYSLLMAYLRNVNRNKIITIVYLLDQLSAINILLIIINQFNLGRKK